MDFYNNDTPLGLNLISCRIYNHLTPLGSGCESPTFGVCEFALEVEFQNSIRLV